MTGGCTYPDVGEEVCEVGGGVLLAGGEEGELLLGAETEGVETVEPGAPVDPEDGAEEPEAGGGGGAAPPVKQLLSAAQNRSGTIFVFQNEFHILPGLIWKAAVCADAPVESRRVAPMKVPECLNNCQQKRLRRTSY